MDSLCYAPNFRYNLTTTGELRPCTAFRENLGYHSAIDWEKRTQLIDGLAKNQFHKGCYECELREGLGIASNRLLKDELSESQVKSLEDKYTLRISTLELNFSSSCNLKCRMCNSDSSSGWIEDEVYLRGLPEVGKFRHRSGDLSRRVFPTKQEIVNFVDSLDLSSLVAINIKGGEPLVQDQFYFLLDHLIERKITDIFLTLTSNVTVVPEKLKSLRSFRSTTIYSSIDAVGTLYQYIRGGKRYDIGTIEKNLVRIKEMTNSRIEIVSCIGAMNLFGLAELYLWILKMYEALGDRSFDIKRGWTPIYEPSYLTSLAIPLDLRQRGYEKSVATVSLFHPRPNEFEREARSYFRLDEETAPTSRNRFVAFTKALDQRRSESILDVVPEYRDLFHSSSTAINTGGDASHAQQQGRA